MKRIFLITTALLLCACSEPMFVSDAAPITITNETPENFELPARFALARVVYNSLQPASAGEAALWADLTETYQEMGHFSQLVIGRHGYYSTEEEMIEAARQQRYNYLLVVDMDPSTGTADISLIHVGSGGVMATDSVVAPHGGQRGFWGGRINNPNRLARVTERLANAAIPSVEEILLGMMERRH